MCFLGGASCAQRWEACQDPRQSPNDTNKDRKGLNRNTRQKKTVIVLLKGKTFTKATVEGEKKLTHGREENLGRRRRKEETSPVIS